MKSPYFPRVPDKVPVKPYKIQVFPYFSHKISIKHLWQIHIWLVVYLPTPEKYEFVSWDDDIPNIWKVIKVMFQITNQTCSMDKIPAVLAVPMDARIRHPQRPAQGSHGLRHHLRGLALPQDVHHPVVNLPKLGLWNMKTLGKLVIQPWHHEFNLSGLGINKWSEILGI